MTKSAKLHARPWILASVVVLAACVPPKKADPIAPPELKISTVSEETAACEAQLRTKMKSKALGFVQIAEIAGELPAVAAAFAAVDTVRYSLSRSRGEIMSVQVEHSKVSEVAGHRVGYDMNKAEKERGSTFNFSVKAHVTTEGSALSLGQYFQVDEKCAIKLTKTHLEKYERDSENRGTYDSQTFYPDGQHRRESDKFAFPAKDFVINFSKQGLHSFANFPQSGSAHMMGIPNAVFSVTDGTAETREEFGLKLKLKVKHLSLGEPAKPMFRIKIGEDAQLGVTYSEIMKRETWTLPQMIWEEIKLGNREVGAMVKSELPKDYLLNNASILYVSEKKPSYEHLAAYWNIDDVQKEAGGKLTRFRLTENPTARIPGTSTAKDLISNDTLQTELPAIQKVRDEILAHAPNDRPAQLQLILDYLAKNYVYDQEMIKTNVVRPLTTEEALARGKGVCQHYAVIFTTLARSLKIPSRIVVGYLLGESAGGHAWVEAEIEPGVWQVIEPQSAASLKQMSTRNYLPTARGGFLEDKNVGFDESTLEFAATEAILRPALPVAKP